MLSGAGRLPSLTHLIQGVAMAGGPAGTHRFSPTSQVQGRRAGRQAEVLSKGSATEP